ncbi:MAG: hypothetical protein ACOCWY_06450 [Thermodesulfobacteriota bacterium]
MTMRILKKRGWQGWILFWILLAAAFPQALPAQEGSAETLNVIGTSAIQEQNIAEAREQAIAEGLASAVNQVALGMVDAESVTQDFQRFTSLLEENADAFVSTYKVLSENPSGDTYRVMLQVTVSRDPLKQRLAAVQTIASDETAPRAKVLFLISEQNLQDIVPRFWWGGAESPGSSYAEEAMAEQMSAAGFDVVAHGNEVPDVALEGAIIFQPDLDNREALDIAKSFLADIVIPGKAIVYKVPETMDEEMPSFNATVSARALRVDTGEEVASVLETVVQKHPEDDDGGLATLTAAGSRAGEQLAAQIAPIWQQTVNPTDRIELTVTGTRNLGNFIRFRKALADTVGVETLQMRDTQPDQAVIEIDYQGPAQALAESLQNLQFQLFNVEIRSVSGQRVAVALVPKGSGSDF